MHVLISLLFAGMFFLIAIGTLFLLLPIQYRFKYEFDKPDHTVSFFTNISFLLSVSYSYYHLQKWQAKIRIMGIPFTLGGKAEKEKDKKDPGKELAQEAVKKEKKDKEELPVIKTMGRMLAKKPLPHLFNVIKRFINVLKPHYLKIRGKVGFKEPHYTGYLSGFIWTLKGLKPSFDVNLEPVWDKEHYQGEVELGGVFKLVVLIYITMGFLFSRKSYQLWREYRLIKKEVG